MIKNYYYLIAGILGIIFSVSHALNGQGSVLPEINSTDVTVETKTTFFYVWHIITAENLLIGLSFLAMSVHKNQLHVRYAAIIIALLMIIRWIVIFSSTLVLNAGGIKNTVMDTIAIAVYTALILSGARSKHRY